MKRWTTILLALAMLLSLLPTEAMAAVGSTDTYCSRSLTGQHDWGGWTITKQATCAQAGARVRVCDTCSYQQTETIPKTSHSWGKWQTTKEATCSKKGEERRKCSVCGTTQTRETDRKAHTWGEWTVITEPTDFTMGTRSHVCKVCGRERTEDFYPEGTLRRGDKGDGVKSLQEKLNAAGYDCGKADGDFGKKTEAAVKALEEARGVEADGIAWPGIQKWLEPTSEISAIDGGNANDFLNQFRDLPISLRNKEDPLVIVTQPEGGTLVADQENSVALTVEAAGGLAPYTYQWREVFFGQDKDIDGETGQTFYPTHPGEYSCRVTDDAGDHEDSIRVMVAHELIITTQPENANLYGKESVRLFCGASYGVPFQSAPGTFGDTYMFAWYNGQGKMVSFSDQGGVDVSEPGDYYCMVQDSEDGLLTSETCTVYVAPPVELETEPLVYARDDEPATLEVHVSGGVAPYKAVWKYGDAETETDEPAAINVDTQEARFDYPVAGYGDYRCTVTDSMGDWAAAEITVRYADLRIKTQPVGGMMASDGSPFPLSVEMFPGDEPFTYTLLKYDTPVGTQVGDGTFQITDSGAYSIHIEDTTGHSIDSDVVQVDDYTFYVKDLLVDGPIDDDYSTTTMKVFTYGGFEPFSYHWVCEENYDDYELQDTIEPSCDVSLPGKYHCVVTDKDGQEATSKTVRVTYEGWTPIIVRQPKDVFVTYREGVPYTAELSCTAISGSPTSQYYSKMMYTWEYKDEDGWRYNLEQGYGNPTVTVTRPGMYRCICTDTYSGMKTITDTVTVIFDLTCVSAKAQPGKGVWTFAGGKGPYTVEVHKVFGNSQTTLLHTTSCAELTTFEWDNDTHYYGDLTVYVLARDAFKQEAATGLTIPPK